MSGFFCDGTIFESLFRIIIMKIRLLVLCIFPLAVYAGGNGYIKDFKAYRQDTSYFARKVYTEHTWQTFFALPEVNRSIDPKSPDIHLLNACLFFAANQLREKQQLKLLAIDFTLRDAAAAHSFQMSSRHFFSHQNPYVPALKNPATRLELFQIDFDMQAENCHMRTLEEDEFTYKELARDIIQGFYNSKPHRENLLTPEFSYSSDAAAISKKGSNYLLYVTQNFYD